MRALLLILALVFTGTPVVSASEPPAEAIVWWSFDPTRFEHPDEEPANGAFLPILRAGVGAGLFGDGTEASILEALLAASEVGRAEHTFAVIDFAAQREEDNSGMRVQRLQAVLELRTGAGHERFLRTIKSIALDAPRAKDTDGAFEAGQYKIMLPGGRTAVAMRDNTDEQWEQIAWCSEPGVFTIGYGVGALERWFASRPADRPTWQDHRDLVNSERPAGDTVLEAYVNIDALRDRFTSAFRFGRTPRMLDALELEGASSVMLHGRFVEDAPGALPLFVLDHTLQETEPAVERVPWTLDAWPDTLRRFAPECGATYALVSAPEWVGLVERGIAIHNATIPDRRLDAHMQSLEAWRRDHGAQLATLLSVLGDHLVLTDGPQPPAPIPGLATVLVPMAGSQAQASSAMSSVLEPFAGRVRTSSTKRRTGWSYSIDSGGLVRLPVWTILERNGRVALIGGWGHACLDAGITWLRSERAPRDE